MSEALRPLEGRRVLPFADIALSVTERVDDPSTAGVDVYVGLEHLDSDTLKISRWGSPLDVESTKLRFYPGDVIYARRRAYQRKLGVAECEGICSAHALVLRARPETCLPDFLPHFLQSDQFHSRALDISVGSLSPTINWKTLARQEFSLPPLHEQRQIVEVLGGVQMTRESYAIAGQCAEELLSAQRFQLLGEDYGGTSAPLASLATLDFGRVYPSEDYCSSGIRLLRPGNIAAGGSIQWEGKTTHLPETYLKPSGAVLIEADDIVMNLTAQSLEDGFLGRVCIAQPEDKSILNQRIARVRAHGVEPRYLFRVLQASQFRDLVVRSAKGSKIKHLYERDLADFPVPVPPPSRQLEVATAIDAAENVVRSLVASASHSAHVSRVLNVALLEGGRL